jgi:hypothetical protein
MVVSITNTIATTGVTDMIATRAMIVTGVITATGVELQRQSPSPPAPRWPPPIRRYAPSPSGFRCAGATSTIVAAPLKKLEAC